MDESLDIHIRLKPETADLAVTPDEVIMLESMLLEWLEVMAAEPPTAEHTTPQE